MRYIYKKNSGVSFSVEPTIRSPHDPAPVQVSQPVGPNATLQSGNATVQQSSPALPVATETQNVALPSTKQSSESEPTTSSHKSDTGLTKTGGKKKPSKRKRPATPVQEKPDVDEPEYDDIDGELIAVPISNPVSLLHEILLRMPSKLTIDHLRKALIVQQFKLALVQTSFYKLLLPCIGFVKTILFAQAQATNNKSENNSDHQYCFDEQMD